MTTKPSPPVETETMPEAPPSPGEGRRLAVVVEAEGSAEMALLRAGEPVVVGRTEPSDLRLDHPTLSRRHARFTRDADRIEVEDLGSRNGTWVGGRRVDRARVEVGDEVMLGSTFACVHALGSSGQSMGVDGELAFQRRLDEEAARARDRGRPFALLMVRAERGAAEDGAWLSRVKAALRPFDRLALYGPSGAQVLLPETGTGEAERIATQIAAPRGATPLFAGVAAFPDAGSTVDELVTASRDAANRATAARPVVVEGQTLFTDGAVIEEGGVVAGRAMRDVLATVKRVATSKVPIVLHGETGTGKEVLARMVHEGGPRRAARMVRVNCGAIPKELVESTLFGHERGAFTGAVQQQRGVFEEADLGTVFLDEIGELPLPAQAALLRVLETGSFSRVGARSEITVDVRVVSATHRDLEQMAEAGQFRADLFYRLSTVVLEIPPLRERPDEIEPLARRFLARANEANGRDVQGISARALDRLCAYRWPGNVRELKNAIERAVVVTRARLIDVEDLPVRVRGSEPAEPPRDMRETGPAVTAPLASTAPPPGAEGDDQSHVRDRVQDYESRIVREALEATGWSRKAAAERLGIPVRTLSYRMKRLGLERPRG